MTRMAATVIAVLSCAAAACGGAGGARSAPAPAERMQESIPDVHAQALAQDATKEEVELAQRALTADKEYMGAVDGKLDRVTVNAIQAFQRRHGLADDGLLNDATLERLRAVVD